jgi:UDP:flavonoid glycosyltransferase YjiC (YdhE family)
VRTDTLADVFKLGGLIDSRKLKALAHYWKKLLDEVKPDLIVGEFTPTLAMVVLGVIPMVTVGTGFSMPPVGRNLPSIRFWDKTISEASKTHEQLMLEAVADTRVALGLPPVSFLSDLFGGEKAFVCVLPELDCYGEYRTEAAIGPLTDAVLPSFRQMDASKKEGPQAFIYLMGEDAKLPEILAALHRSKVPCDGYIRQFDRSRMPGGAANIHLYDTPQPLNDILPDRALLIHHGGMSTSDIALRLGVPQLVLSRHLEQKTNGALLMKAGVAHMLMAHSDSDLSRIEAFCKGMVADAPLHARAVAKAKAIAAQKSKPAVEVVTAACCELVA